MTKEPERLPRTDGHASTRTGTRPILDPDHDEQMARATWSRERLAAFDPAENPLKTAQAWLEGYAFRLSEAERSRHYPNATEADYRKMLHWADDPAQDRQHEALDLLLGRIRQHPNPPYTPEVLLVEYAALFRIPVYARLRDNFPERMRAWFDRVETYLSIGADDAKQDDFSAAVGDQQSTANRDDGLGPEGVTVSQLLDAVDCRGGISDTTFLRIRTEAGLKSPRGRAGANRRYTPDEMDRIYGVVRDGNWDHRVEMMRDWAPFTKSYRQ